MTEEELAQQNTELKLYSLANELNKIAETLSTLELQLMLMPYDQKHIYAEMERVLEQYKTVSETFLSEVKKYCSGNKVVGISIYKYYKELLKLKNWMGKF